MTDGQHYRRPAEAQTKDTIRDLREELYEGFRSRSAALRWLQRLAVRTLGEVPTRLFAGFANQFRPDSQADEGVLLGAFLRPEPRTRDFDQGVPERVRQQWAADVIAPVQAASFRSLRKDAGEYVGETESNDDDGHDPGEQSIAMRPALEELDDFQAAALGRLLDGGLDDRAAILDWGDELLVATRGEPLGPSDDLAAPGEFIRDLHNDVNGDRIVADTRPHWTRFRQWWLCRNVLPGFNRAVRDLTKRTAEEPTGKSTEPRDGRSI